MKIFRYICQNLPDDAPLDAAESAQLLRHMPLKTLANLAVALGLLRSPQASKMKRDALVHLVSENADIHDIQMALLPS